MYLYLLVDLIYHIILKIQFLAHGRATAVQMGCLTGSDEKLCVFACFRCIVTLAVVWGCIEAGRLARRHLGATCPNKSVSDQKLAEVESSQNGPKQNRTKLAKSRFVILHRPRVYLISHRDCLDGEVTPRPNLHWQKCDGSEVSTGRGIAGSVSGI